MHHARFFHGIKAWIVNESGEVLLLKTNPTTLVGRTGEPYRDLPWGRVDQGETPEDTLRRELREELGITDIALGSYKGTTLSPITIPVDDDVYGLFLSVYDCVLFHPSLQLSDEHLDIAWVSVDSAKVLLSVKYPAWFLDLL